MRSCMEPCGDWTSWWEQTMPRLQEWIWKRYMYMYVFGMQNLLCFRMSVERDVLDCL